VPARPDKKKDKQENLQAVRTATAQQKEAKASTVEQEKAKEPASKEEEKTPKKEHDGAEASTMEKAKKPNVEEEQVKTSTMAHESTAEPTSEPALPVSHSPKTPDGLTEKDVETLGKLVPARPDEKKDK